MDGGVCASFLLPEKRHGGFDLFLSLRWLIEDVVVLSLDGNAGDGKRGGEREQDAKKGKKGKLERKRSKKTANFAERSFEEEEKKWRRSKGSR